MTNSNNHKDIIGQCDFCGKDIHKGEYFVESDELLCSGCCIELDLESIFSEEKPVTINDLSSREKSI